MARNILIGMWEYLSSEAQLNRFEDVIRNPGLINSSNGNMFVPHIRFDGNSRHFDDIIENGKSQIWNHKQNDALGLFLDCLINSIKSGEVGEEDWKKGNRLKLIIKMIQYFQKTSFYEMPDSGAWEESERINTSSIALVTSALENLSGIMYKNNIQNINVKKFNIAINKLKHSLNSKDVLNEKALDELIDNGYNRILKHLTLGGESPDYEIHDPRYRTADAALLNLVYPAKLSRIKTEDKKRVLSIVGTLKGDYGIRRYDGDNYQSANFWFQGIKTDTDELSIEKRDRAFIKNTEAEWFFDSWYALASLIVYNESAESKYLNQAVKSMNRSLSQITQKNMIGADGRVVPANALPESYNFIYFEGKFIAAPSPIIPLNWAKSSMTLMLYRMLEIVDKKN